MGVQARQVFGGCAWQDSQPLGMGMQETNCCTATTVNCLPRYIRPARTGEMNSTLPELLLLLLLPPLVATTRRRCAALQRCRAPVLDVACPLKAILRLMVPPRARAECSRAVAGRRAGGAAISWDLCAMQVLVACLHWRQRLQAVQATCRPALAPCTGQGPRTRPGRSHRACTIALRPVPASDRPRSQRPETAASPFGSTRCWRPQALGPIRSKWRRDGCAGW